jgi:lipopolysaccharide transport system permease protein
MKGHTTGRHHEDVWMVQSRDPGMIATAREVWHHRRFLRLLGYRALRKTYARTVLGTWWVLIAPLFPIAVRTLIFGGLVGVTSEGIPYFLFLTAGSVAWDLFSSALMWSTRGLELNRGVLSHVYLPKVIMPLSTMSPAIKDFLVSLGVLTLATLYYLVRDHHLYLTFGLPTLWAIAAIVMVLLYAFSLGLFLSVWGETARDARFILAQVLNIWMFVTPVLYPLSSVPGRWRTVAEWNPMVPVVQTFKWGVLGIGEVNLWALGRTALVIAITMWLGLIYFNRSEARAAEGL